jgi:ribosome-binding ATPase YchF (GTP1/OBG family)
MKAKEHLDAGSPLSKIKTLNFEHLADLQLLTAKPVIYVFNVDEKTLADEPAKRKLAQSTEPAKAIFVCAKLEAELRGLDEADRSELLRSYAQDQSGLVQLVHAAYDILGLQSFLTAGEKEVRAWTIAKDSTAPQAAGAIHTDFERGFIAAQIVTYDDLVSAGSLPAARAAGKVRTEGKDYIMQPGDVVEFKFNV